MLGVPIQTNTSLYTKKLIEVFQYSLLNPHKNSTFSVKWLSRNSSVKTSYPATIPFTKWV